MGQTEATVIAPTLPPTPIQAQPWWQGDQVIFFARYAGTERVWGGWGSLQAHQRPGREGNLYGRDNV